MSLSAPDLVRTLDANRVIDAGCLEDIEPLVRQHRDGAQLANRLVEDGFLTAYQAEQVLAGRAEELIFGDYRLLEPIGQGGMGQVFKAAHLRLGRIVALKMIRRQSLLTTENPDELIRRFQREAQAVAQLLHPNIVILFDYDECDGTHFIAMEYVDGVDLTKMVQSQGPLAIPHACDIIRQAASGLQHAHEFGMVHRDIKPSNLLVTRPSTPASIRYQRPAGSRPSHSPVKLGDTPLPATRSNTGGVLKILDMGLVRFAGTIEDQDTMSALTMQGTVIGTPDYIAPEQARDATKVDIRADLYSLGCTFYYLLTGRPPFPTGTSVEKLFKHQNEQPMALESIRPGCAPEVLGIVQRLMAKSPESRFQTPTELADAIATIPPEAIGLAGRARAEAPSKVVATAAEVAKSERDPAQVVSPTQFYSADSLILPAKKAGVLQGHKGYVTAVEFSPDGRRLVTGGVDGTARLWDVGMARPAERNLDQGTGLGEVQALHFDPSGKTLFSGSTAMDGHNWRWDWVNPVQNVRSRFQNDDYRMTCFAATPDSQKLAAGSHTAVLVFDVGGSKRPTILKGHRGDVRALAWSANGKKLYSAGNDKTVQVWEPGRYFGVHRASFVGHADTVAAISVTPDGSLLASGSLDGVIRLWDASGESTDCVAVLGGHSGGIRALRFTPNGNLLVSVGDGGQVCLWEVTEQAKVREWQIDKSMMHSIAISPNCRFLATGLGDGLVAFYDLELFAAEDVPQAPAVLASV